MAGEEVFIASAIHSVGALIVCLSMYYFAHKQGSQLWQNIWLVAMFLILTYDFTVQRVAFNVVGTYDLRDLAFSFLHVIMWITVLMFGVLLLNLTLMMFKGLYKAVTKSGYDEDDTGGV